MLKDESTKELQQVATYLAKADYPEGHLTGWMSNLDKKNVANLVILDSVLSIGQNVKQTFETIEKYEKDLKSFNERGFYYNYTINDEGDLVTDKVNQTPNEPVLKTSLQVFNEMVKAFMNGVNDRSVSIEGGGRKEITKFLEAMNQGNVKELKKRSRMDKLTGKNKDLDVK